VAITHAIPSLAAMKKANRCGWPFSWRHFITLEACNAHAQTGIGDR